MVQSQNARVGRGEGRGRENTNGSIIERHFQRSCVKLFCIRTGTGVSGQEGLVIILLAFPFSCLPLARVCPILLPNSVTWSLWEATGEPGPQWFSPARAKASCSLPLYLSTTFNIYLKLQFYELCFLYHWLKWSQSNFTLIVFDAYFSLCSCVLR